MMIFGLPRYLAVRYVAVLAFLAATLAGVLRSWWSWPVALLVAAGLVVGVMIAVVGGGELTMWIEDRRRGRR